MPRDGEAPNPEHDGVEVDDDGVHDRRRCYSKVLRPARLLRVATLAITPRARRPAPDFDVPQPLPEAPSVRPKATRRSSSRQ
jgi:hypothetical protein